MLFPLQKLPNAAQISKWDKETVDFGLPDTLLMENAARSAIKLLSNKLGCLKDKNVLVLMGGGNNGGDAACMARILKDLGIANLLLIHTKPLDRLKGPARFHTELALKDGVRFEELDLQKPLNFPYGINSLNFTPEIIIDGLIGVGLQSDLSEEIQKLILAVNSFASMIKAFIFSIDIPSGLNADTGLPMPTAIMANMTATMAFAKKGLILPRAKAWTGEVYICDIGMPVAQSKTRIPDLYLLDGRLLLSPPIFPKNSYKNVYGHVTIIGGQKGLSGAAHLASLSALRSGAGLVTACSPPNSINKVKGNLAELMTLPVGDGDDWPIMENGEKNAALPENFLSLIKESQALVVGPGMGRNKQAEGFLHSILMSDRPPTIFDADALFHLANNSHWRDLLRENDAITPHPGEAARLLSCSTKDLERNRIEKLTELETKLKCVIIIKGVNTLIGQAASPTLICPFDIPQMAIGGAGDVLAGCLGAMIASGKTNMSKINVFNEIMTICAKAVMRHIVAGMICTNKYPDRGALASDLADALAGVSNFITNLDIKNLEEGLAPWPNY